MAEKGGGIHTCKAPEPKVVEFGNSVDFNESAHLDLHFSSSGL